MEHSELIKTGHRLRNLGRYSEAYDYYCQATAVKDDLRISLDTAGMHVEQGLIDEGLDLINTATAKFVAHWKRDWTRILPAFLRQV